MNIAHGAAGAALEQQLIAALVAFSGNQELRDVDPHASLVDVLDSLGHFTFLLTLEDAFDIDIPDDRFSFAAMGTLDGVLQVVRECSARRADAA